MLYNLIILLLIYIVVILYIGFVIFTSENDFYKNLVNFMGILAVSAIFLHCFYLIYIYFSLINNFGNPGPRGIKGKKGKSGRKGICTAKCGQQSCVKIIETNINKHLEGNKLGALENQLLRDKINEMCFSNNYQGILKKEFDNKPNEKEIIEYLSDICIKWIDTVLKYKNGVRFLNGVDFEEGYFPKGATPFEEIKKYEIWSWGSTYKIKPIIRKQCVKKTDVDNSDLAQLKLVFTNNYEKPLFSNKFRETIHGPENCEYNQLGEDRTNPDGITECYSYDEQSQTVTTRKVWDQKVYIDFDQSFSFYNVRPTILNGKWYFPLGTVWCGSNKYRPEKKTVMVEYNESKDSTSFPESWKLIWTNMSEFKDKLGYVTQNENLDKTKLQKKCVGCVEESNRICIWRPIAPPGYVAYGDYVTKDSIVPLTNKQLKKAPKIDSPPPNTILCIKKDCSERININKGTSVWSEKGFSYTYRETIDSTPQVNTFSRISIWPCGINDDKEEFSNYSSSKLEKITTGGYNLFRANDSTQDRPPLGIKSENSEEDPQGKYGYEIKGSCYYALPTEDEDYPTNELGTGWLGGKHREKKYSIFTKLGQPESAIVRPYPDISVDEIQNYKNMKKVWNKSKEADIYLLQHYKTPDKCCENTFVIRTYDERNNPKDNEEKNYFGYLNCDNIENKISNSPEFFEDKKIFWSLELVEDEKIEARYRNENDKQIKIRNEYSIVKIKSTFNNKYLNYFNNKLSLESEGSMWTLDPSTGFDLMKL